MCVYIVSHSYTERERKQWYCYCYCYYTERNQTELREEVSFVHPVLGEVQYKIWNTRQEDKERKKRERNGSIS